MKYYKVMKNNLTSSPTKMCRGLHLNHDGRICNFFVVQCDLQESSEKVVDSVRTPLLAKYRLVLEKSGTENTPKSVDLKNRRLGKHNNLSTHWQNFPQIVTSVADVTSKFDNGVLHAVEYGMTRKAR